MLTTLKCVVRVVYEDDFPYRPIRRVQTIISFDICLIVIIVYVSLIFRLNTDSFLERILVFLSQLVLASTVFLDIYERIEG